eukprot:TRINITY_DN65753_c5_g1_i3.p1 TRINITY_DN65753_c5_g1~~TRINITY_DN65753_c5_g1_i3.p1  ORF type:complete len:602 (-),score=290.78 TRINITY_DN65753_c5_g1_i3:1256-2920(-)
MRAYFYEILNPHELLAGATPSLKEVGPWVYKNYKENFNLTWNADRSEVEYQTWSYYVFDEEESAMPRDYLINALNIAFLGVAGNYHETNKFKLWFEYFNTTDSERLFQRHTADEFLFGYWDPFASSPFLYPGIVQNYTNKTAASVSQLYTMTTGIDRNPNTFRHYRQFKGMDVVTYCPHPPTCANDERLITWGTREASIVDGSDGSQLYPGWATLGSSFPLWEPDAFRTVKFVNQVDGPNEAKVKYQGVDLLRFVMSPDEWLNSTQNPRNALFYQNWSQGLFNVTRMAQKELLWVSQPHFRNVGEPVYSSIDVDYTVDIKEESFIDIEPVSGAAFRLKKRTQLNLLIYPVSGIPNPGSPEPITWFEHVKPRLVPIMWIEVEDTIDDDDLQNFKNKVYGGLFLADLALYGGTSIGVIMLGLGTWLLYASHRKRKELTDRFYRKSRSNSRVSVHGNGDLNGAAAGGASSYQNGDSIDNDEIASGNHAAAKAARDAANASESRIIIDANTDDDDLEAIDADDLGESKKQRHNEATHLLSGTQASSDTYSGLGDEQKS